MNMKSIIGDLKFIQRIYYFDYSDAWKTITGEEKTSKSLISNLNIESQKTLFENTKSHTYEIVIKNFESLIPDSLFITDSIY